MMTALSYVLSYVTLWFFTVMFLWLIDRILLDEREQTTWVGLCLGGGLLVGVVELAGVATVHIGYPFWLFVVTSLS